MPSQQIDYLDASGNVAASITAHRRLFGGDVTFDIAMPTREVKGLTSQQFGAIIYLSLVEWEHEGPSSELGPIPPISARPE